jgi:hypothetical protein
MLPPADDAGVKTGQSRHGLPDRGSRVLTVEFDVSPPQPAKLGAAQPGERHQLPQRRIGRVGRQRQKPT